jgi:hypothetical protein
MMEEVEHEDQYSRKHRIAQLVEWVRNATMDPESWINTYPRSQPGFPIIENGRLGWDFEEHLKASLIREAQMRWTVADSSARSYARIVIETVEPELIAHIKKS